AGVEAVVLCRQERCETHGGYELSHWYRIAKFSYTIDRMKRSAGVLALLLIAPAAWPQGLAPGILLLREIKNHLKKEFSSLPNYTCLETAQRHHRAPGPKSTLKPMDVVRLEVLNTGNYEMYAAPGEIDFREDSPFAFSTQGLTASGLFASFL